MGWQSDGPRTLQGVFLERNGIVARRRFLACLFQAETSLRGRLLLRQPVIEPSYPICLMDRHGFSGVIRNRRFLGAVFLLGD